jgi:hypothetical protein
MEGSLKDIERARKFKLVDAIVLVAATAGGLALGKAAAAEDATRNDAAADYLVSVALLWTLAIFALNLTRYRVPRPEVACSPGFSAGVAVSVTLFADFIYYAFLTQHRSSFWRITIVALPAKILRYLLMCVQNLASSGSCTAAVAAVWLVTAMAGCWIAQKTWLDRTGRVLGVFWLLATAMYWPSQ